MRRAPLSVLGVLLLAPGPVWSQSSQAASDEGGVVELRTENGFAAAWIEALDALGWEVEAMGDSAWAQKPGGPRVLVRAGTPFVEADGTVVQLVNAPYLADGDLFVPVQLVTELADHSAPLLEEIMARASEETGGFVGPADEGPTAWESDRRVVVVDAGHGGRDLGALGHGGVQEKDVALGTARALARALEARGFEVRMTREGDTFIPVWERGPLANELRAGVPGVFVSLHANSNADSRELRGFETFFLAEARTEHERRMAEMENTPPSSLGDRELGPPDSDLSIMLDELRSRDTQRWSAHLAGMVQEELAFVHPGPNRGVSQAPLAVITNALMPAVLVELGYVTHSEEEALLTEESFQEAAADALARAVEHFFADYPPGRGRIPTGSRE